MFVLHNVTSHRVSLTLLPIERAAEGVPGWRAKRFVRQRTIHLVIEPHKNIDLAAHGYSESDALAQKSVLDALRLGHVRRVKNDGGGYAENQFAKQEAITQPDARNLLTAEPEPEPEPEQETSVVRTPFVAKKKKR